MRAFLTAREFAKLENWCAVSDGVHKSGGVQNYRRKWREQLDARRGHMTHRQRTSETPADERWIDLDESDIDFITKLRSKPKDGGWQRDLMAIFGGVQFTAEVDG